MSIAMVIATAQALFLAEDEPEFDPNIVSPGVAGFVVTGLIALAVIFLGFDLVRRLRRGRYREEIRQALAQELAERDAAARADAGTGSTPEAAVDETGASGTGESGAGASQTEPGDPPRS